MENLEKTFKALSCRSRLLMLWLLSKTPLCVCEIMGILGITQTNASRHLNYLKNAGLVKAERQEQWVVYSLRDDLPEAVKRIVEASVDAVSQFCDIEDLRQKLDMVVADKSYRIKHARRRGGDG